MSTLDFEIILQFLLERIELVPFCQFRSQFDEAINVMGSIDVKDAPFLAVGLFLKADAIWTEDKDFLRQKALRVYRTAELIKVLEHG